MKAELLDLICCPACQGSLSITPTVTQASEIWAGQLTCPRCQTAYPIIKGMPHLYVNDEKWTTKAKEAEGWVTIHKQLGQYMIVPNSVDLQIPYYPEEPWIGIARSFELALEQLQLTGQETILDLGAGRGWAAKAFAKRGCRVIALDVVPDEIVGLGRGRALMDDAQVYFDRLIADGENLPFFANRFDIVFSAAALHHSSHLQLLLQNIHKVLKPRGRLCAINEPCISLITDEKKALHQSAHEELEAGINETRPNLLTYLSCLQENDFCIRQLTPPAMVTMTPEQKLNWTRLLGVSWPDLSLTNSLQILKEIIFYVRRHLALLQKGWHIPQTWRQITAVRDKSLEREFLIWCGGEIFILAEKQ